MCLFSSEFCFGVLNCCLRRRVSYMYFVKDSELYLIISNNKSVAFLINYHITLRMVHLAFLIIKVEALKMTPK